MTATPTGDDVLGHLPDPQGYAWIAPGRAMVGWGVADRICPSGPDRFSVARDWAAAALTPGDVAFGAFTFTPDGTTSALVRPERRLTGPGPHPGPVEPLPAPGRVRYAGGGLAELAWMEAVQAATGRIAAGELEKVVLARDVQVWSDRPLDPRTLARRLVRTFPTCMTFLHEGFVGATPELLVSRTGDRVASLVLAGSAPPDPAAGRALLASAKDREEHRYAAESVREALGPVCAELTVSEPGLLVLANVQHLATRVTGRLATDVHVLDLVAALHPTAAVCGTPTPVAAEVLAELERMDRGRYAGPVGWCDGRGDGEFGIALRCAEIDGTRARLFAGAGIVEGSLPERELEETRMKLRAMRSALEG